MNTTCYRDLHHRKISVLEEISDTGPFYNHYATCAIPIFYTEFLAIRPRIESELIKIKERRDNRVEEHAYQQRRQKVEDYYNKLKAGNKFKILPILCEFRKLSIIKTFQSSSTSTALSDLQNDLVGALLKEDLEKWCTQTQEAFAEKLGYLNWKTASSHKLHPVYRLSSLFSCTECERKSPGDQILTFEGACTHRCPERNRKRRDKQVWKPEQFIPHESVSHPDLGVSGMITEIHYRRERL